MNDRGGHKLNVVDFKYSRSICEFTRVIEVRGEKVRCGAGMRKYKR